MNDDFKAEVSGGYLLIAIKIPTYTCAACRVVHTLEVRSDRVAQLFKAQYPITAAFTSPDGWGHVVVDNVTGQHALVCERCYEPVALLRQASEIATEKAKALLAKRIKEIR